MGLCKLLLIKKTQWETLKSEIYHNLNTYGPVQIILQNQIMQIKSGNF